MASENNQPDTLPKAPNQGDTLALELPKQYEVLGKINEGGMGAIYKVRNQFTGGVFAIKVLRPECAQNEEIQKRFTNEAKAASSLKHPHICQVHDFGLSENHVPYLVMDWIDGLSLLARVREKGPLPVHEAVTIFLQVTSALSHAHEHKLVHRDLKPANIMLSTFAGGERTTVHVVDFGIAKVLHDDDEMYQSQGLTKTGIVVGTPLFMSPEQAKGRKIDKRADIYSFGCLMYYALSGRPPFLGDTSVDTMYKHITEEVPALSPLLKIPPVLNRIILKAMEKEPDDRYQSMESLAADLKMVSKGVEIKHKPLAIERRKRRKALTTVLFFVGGFIIMYGLSITLQNIPGLVNASANKQVQGKPAK